MLMWENKTTKENIGYVDESFNSQCKEKTTKQKAEVKINNKWGVDCKKISICGICCHGFDILGIYVDVLKNLHLIFKSLYVHMHGEISKLLIISKTTDCDRYEVVYVSHK